MLPLTSRPGRTRRPARRVRPALEVLEDRTVPAGVWSPQGPGPMLNGQPIGLDPQGNPDVGAVEAIAADPTDANVLFIGTVNGGVWRTTNALASAPHWEPLTDALPSLAVGSLAFSPVNDHVLYAGTADFTSGSFYTFNGPNGQRISNGGDAVGVYKSTDFGNTWTVLGTSTFQNNKIHVILPTALAGGQEVMAGTDRGLFLSPDGGATWAPGGAGLPGRTVTSLVADPTDATHMTYYAAVLKHGVYRSVNGGATWVDLNGSTVSQFMVVPVTTIQTAVQTADNLRLAVNHAPGTDTLILLTGNPGGTTPTSPGISYVYWLPNAAAVAPGSATWTEMLPLDDANKSSLGGPGSINEDDDSADKLAIAADPFSGVGVWVVGSTGDTQGGGERTLVLEGNLVSAAPDTQWHLAVYNGASGGPDGPTITHSDGRALAFDAAGDLLMGSDGGIYKLVHPDFPANQRYWVSVIGDLQDTEFYSVGYDALNHVIVGGSQDNGFPEQQQLNNAVWVTGHGDDVTGVAVDNRGPDALRYEIGSAFEEFNVFVYGPSNVLLGSGNLPLASTPGGAAQSGIVGADLQDKPLKQGASIPFALNAVSPYQLLLGYYNLYESFDQGGTVSVVTPAGMQGIVSALAYGGHSGGAADAGVAWVGTDAGELFLRTTAGGAFTLVNNFNNSAVVRIVLDPDRWQTAYVVTVDGNVWRTGDAGKSWTNIVGNLVGLVQKPRALTIFNPTPTPGDEVLVIGGLGGVFYTRNPQLGAGTVWAPLGTGLPNAQVYDLTYNAADDVLAAATFGRGAWLLTNVAALLRPPQPALVTGAGAGGLSQVNLFDPVTGTLRQSFLAFGPTFTGGVRVAVADVNGDGILDTIAGAGPGGGPQVTVFDGQTFQVIFSLYAWPTSFTGGVWVAGGDVNGDGRADIIVGADAGGGPEVKVFSGLDGSLLRDFFAFPVTFHGGVRVAAGDVDGDGRADIIAGAGAGAGPQVSVFRGTDLAVLRTFYACPASFTGGVYVAAGDVNGDGLADVVAGAGPGGGPQVSVFDAQAGKLLETFFAFPASFTGGVRVSTVTVAGLARPAIVAAAGPGAGPEVAVFDSSTLAVLDAFFAYDPTFRGGAFAGGA